MRLNVIAFAVTAGLFWGAGILIVAIANAIWPSYGVAVLQLAASVYPGYQPAGTFGSIVVGTLYGLVDGAVAGAIFAWLYNLTLRRLAGA